MWYTVTWPSTMQTFLFLENPVSPLGQHQPVGQSSPVETNQGADDSSTNTNRSTPSTTCTTQSTPTPIVSSYKDKKGSHGKHTTGAQPDICKHHPVEADR